MHYIEHQVRGNALFLPFFSYNYYYIRCLRCETEINCGCLKCDNFKLHSLAPEWMKCWTKVVENWRKVTYSWGIHLNAVCLHQWLQILLQKYEHLHAKDSREYTQKQLQRIFVKKERKQTKKEKNLILAACWRLLLPAPEIFPPMFVLMKHWFTIMWHHLALMSSGFKQTTRW